MSSTRYVVEKQPRTEETALTRLKELSAEKLELEELSAEELELVAGGYSAYDPLGWIHYFGWLFRI